VFDTEIKTHHKFQANKTRLSYTANINTDLDVIRWSLWNFIIRAKGLNII